MIGSNKKCFLLLQFVLVTVTLTGSGITWETNFWTYLWRVIMIWLLGMWRCMLTLRRTIPLAGHPELKWRELSTRQHWLLFVSWVDTMWPAAAGCYDFPFPAEMDLYLWIRKKPFSIKLLLLVFFFFSTGKEQDSITVLLVTVFNPVGRGWETDI